MPTGIYRPIKKQWGVGLVTGKGNFFHSEWCDNGHKEATIKARELAEEWGPSIEAGTAHVVMFRIFPPGLPQNVKVKG